MNGQFHTPAGRDGHLLYLDFDGVLHHDEVYRHPRRGIFLRAPMNFSLFQHAQLLEHCLDPYPNVQIVLSTSWVRELRFSRALKRLPLMLQKRVVGATYHTRMDGELFVQKPRGVQIVEDVERRRPRSWLALDNDDKGWPQEALEHLVLSDDVLGISKLSVLVTMQRKFRLNFGGAT